MDKNKATIISDILARLPYGPIKCAVYSDIPHFNKEDGTEHVDLTVPEIVELTVTDHDILTYFAQGEVVHDIKPYLHPMSSMTEEDEHELNSIKRKMRFDEEIYLMGDFFYKKHLDIRHLIEKGLALPAEEGMYNN